jgi:hypothetical protein
VTTSGDYERASEGYPPTVETLLRRLAWVDRYDWAYWRSVPRGQVQRGGCVAYANAAAGEVIS